MSDPPTKQLLKAQWLYPGASPLQRDAAVVIVKDHILSVGSSKSLMREHPDAQVTDFGDAIIFPGLINAHTHLELSLLHPLAPLPFTDWLLNLMRTLTVSQANDTKNARPISDGLRQCHRFGVTAVGDISTSPAVARSVFSNVLCLLRIVRYGEVRGMGARRINIEQHIQKARVPSYDAPCLRAGISPHAPYSLEPAGYMRCLEIARMDGLPLTTHLAETADEAPFLANHTGPFQKLWETIGGWDDQIPTFPSGPIRFAASLGLLDYPTSLAHVNYCDDAELALLAAGKASVVYCPRTHRYFGHPPHRWRDMLAAGINVAVGTDSCASSPDLNIVDDLRLLHEIAPEYPVEELWQMATARGAKALQWDNEIGNIEPGKFADFTIFHATSDQPLTEILENPSRLPHQLWIGGKKITNTRPASPC